MKKVLTLIISLLFLTNILFAAYSRYDYDDLKEKKSHKKLYYGLALTLVGGFLIYDGFSQVEEDISRPSVDYTSVLHYEWVQGDTQYGKTTYTLKSGIGDPYYNEGQSYSVIPNAIFNTGNVDLYNVNVEVRYYIKDAGGALNIYDLLKDGESLVGGEQTTDYYHTVSVKNVSLEKNKFCEWTDVWKYTTASTNPPKGNDRDNDLEIIDKTATLTNQGVYLGENALAEKDNATESGAIEVRVKLKPHENYKPIYSKKNKSDLEGVAGILLVTAGIYFLLDYAFGFTEFKRYMKKNDMDFRLASRPSEYKLLLEKRL